MSTDRIRIFSILPALTAILSAPALFAQEPDPAARKPDPAAVEYYSKGLELLRNRDFPNAAIAMEQAVTADSTYGDAHYALAKTYKVLNRFQRAIRAFEAATLHGVSSEGALERIPAQLADIYKKSAVQSFKQKSTARRSAASRRPWNGVPATPICTTLSASATRLSGSTPPRPRLFRMPSMRTPPT